MTALSDKMPSVRLAAVEALGQFREVGHSGALALTAWSGRQKTALLVLRRRALAWSGGVSRDHFETSHDRRDFLVRGSLEQARAALAEMRKAEPNNYDFPDSSKSVEQALRTLSHRKWRQNIEDVYSGHTWIARGLIALVGYLFWIALLYHVILRLFPLGLLEWNEFLEGLCAVSNVPWLGTVVTR